MNESRCILKGVLQSGLPDLYWGFLSIITPNFDPMGLLPLQLTLKPTIPLRTGHRPTEPDRAWVKW